MTVELGKWYPEMPPRLPEETNDQYTDRLTGADQTSRRPYDHKRNRQCSIGYHRECSDPEGLTCKCPCHSEVPSEIVMLVGPIAHWWDDNWDTPEHQQYAAWRDKVSAFLVGHGYLVYRPHEAFKGTWNEDAQDVNDAAVDAAKFLVDLSPADVISQGTEREIRYAVEDHVPPKPIFRCAPADETGADGALRTLLIRLQLGLCQVCHKEPAYNVAAMTGVPMSFAYGLGCLRANAHPLEAVVGNTAMTGGLDQAAEWWQELVTDTLTHLDVTREAFDAMVAEAIADQAEYFAQEAAVEKAQAEAEADEENRENAAALKGLQVAAMEATEAAELAAEANAVGGE